MLEIKSITTKKQNSQDFLNYQKDNYKINNYF